MAAPRVTVLMPVYNGEMFLREAVESVLQQSFADFEFLIINDGSTDRTAEILHEFNDRRIKVVQNRENLKIVATLNTGLELTRAELVARMDCDDLCKPHRLRRQVSFMERNPQVGLVGTWAEVIDDPRGRFYKPYKDHERLKAELLFNSAFVHPTVMIRKNVLQKHGLRYDPEMMHVEDFDLWINMSQVCRLANIPSVLFSYRLHGSNVSRVHQKVQRNNARKLYARELRLLGIEATEDELAMHQALALYEFDPGQAPIDTAKTWLVRLFEANLSLKRYDVSALAQVLGGRWQAVCRRSPETSLQRVKRFLSVPFAKRALLGAAWGKLGF